MYLDMIESALDPRGSGFVELQSLQRFYKATIMSYGQTGDGKQEAERDMRLMIGGDGTQCSVMDYRNLLRRRFEVNIGALERISRIALAEVTVNELRDTRGAERQAVVVAKLADDEKKRRSISENDSDAKANREAARRASLELMNEATSPAFQVKWMMRNVDAHTSGEKLHLNEAREDIKFRRRSLSSTVANAEAEKHLSSYSSEN